MGRAKVVDTAAALRIGPGPMTDALRALRDRERRLLAAYMHFGREHGARIDQPGVCWPTDTEVAAHLGRSPATVRRSRRLLATLPTPWIALRVVPAFGTLPNGETSLHGVNVVMLLKVGAPEEGPTVEQLVAATTTMRRIEHDLKKARAHVETLTEKLHRVHDQAAANDDAAPAAPRSHNAPSVLITPAWSPRKALRPSLEGGGKSHVA